MIRNQGELRIDVSEGVDKDAVNALIARLVGGLLDEGEAVLKKSGSVCVYAMKLCGRKVLVKRFNYKGSVHAFLKKFTESRARRLFKISTAFCAKGVPVPRPIACVESKKESYFVSEYIDATDDLGHLAKKKQFDSIEGLADGLARGVSAFHGNGGVHGDLKWTNILVTCANKPACYFIDIDQARLCGSPDLKGIAKDLVNFIGYGKRMKKNEWVSEEFLPAYRRSLSPSLDAALDFDAIVLAAKRSYESWKKRSEGR